MKKKSLIISLSVMIAIVCIVTSFGGCAGTGSRIDLVKAVDFGFSRDGAESL